MRILIAEDDATSRTLLTVVLKQFGYEVEVTRDGAEAWEALQRPDAPLLVVLDWMMPGMDGIEVLERVRALDSDRPPYVIMLTALEGKQYVAQALDAGADDYVTKPFDHLELRARVGVGARVARLRERLAREATTDELTGLDNRRRGLRALGNELARARRDGLGLSVGMIDVDHFKHVNDTHGHPVGDEVLRELAARLRSGVRPYDHVFRYGGEEFVAVICGSQKPLPWSRLLTRVSERPFETTVGPLSITVSIGFTSCDGRCDAVTLLDAADRGLYQAKADGRNRMVGPVRPRSPADGPAPGVAPESHTPTETDQGGREATAARETARRSVLLAVPDRTSSGMLSAMLTRIGFQTESLPDGREALERLRAPDAPRIALVDWLLPGLDGLALCRELADGPSQHARHVILLVSPEQKMSIPDALAAGADDYLSKPLEPVELTTRVEQAVRWLAVRDELATATERLELALSDGTPP